MPAVQVRLPGCVASCLHNSAPCSRLARLAWSVSLLLQDAHATPESDAKMESLLHPVLQGGAPHLEVLRPPSPGLLVVTALLIDLVLLLLLHLASELPPAEAQQAVCLRQ